MTAGEIVPLVLFGAGVYFLFKVFEFLRNAANALREKDK